MKRIPVVKIVFTNKKQIELDITYWHIDQENSNDEVLVFYNDSGELFIVIESNVNFMTTLIREIPEIGDPPPLRKRLDPRNMQPFL